jgi:hypothetical protein
MNSIIEQSLQAFAPEPETVTQRARRKSDIAKEALFAQPLPESTRTYGPVSNEELYSSVCHRIQQKGFTIIEEDFTSANKNQIMLCKLILSTPEHTKLDKTIAILNSYDKSRSVNIASGATVSVCSNGMFWGSESNFKRKHHSNIWDDVTAAVDAQIDALQDQLSKLNAFYVHSQYDRVSAKTIASLAGRLYFKEILSPNMLSDLKKEIHNSENFRMSVNENGELEGGSVWKFYNNCTEAMKRTPAYKYTKNYSALTKMIAEDRGYFIDQ